MDKFKNIAAETAMAKTAEPNGLSTSTTGSSSLELASRPKIEKFRKRVLLIVHDSFEASSQNATFEEEMTRAKVWSDLLFEIVPENRLNDAFRRAFRDHDSSFPVNAYEIKAAWEAIEREEATSAAEAEKKHVSENAIEYCPNKRNHVLDADTGEDHGMVEYADPDDRSKGVLRPCFDCRKSAFEASVARHIQAKQDSAPRDTSRSKPEEMSAAIRRIVKPVTDDRYRAPETAEEIVVRAYNEAKADWSTAPESAKPEKLRACQLLIHALDHIREARRSDA